MSKASQKEILLRTLEDAPDWTPSWALIKVSTPYGWLGSGTLQQCRAMESEGLIVKEMQGKYIYYKIAEKGKDYLRTLEGKESEFMKKWRKDFMQPKIEIKEFKKGLFD